MPDKASPDIITGTREELDRWRALIGLPPIDDRDWASARNNYSAWRKSYRNQWYNSLPFASRPFTLFGAITIDIDQAEKIMRQRGFEQVSDEATAPDATSSITDPIAERARLDALGPFDANRQTSAGTGQTANPGDVRVTPLAGTNYGIIQVYQQNLQTGEYEWVDAGYSPIPLSQAGELTEQGRYELDAAVRQAEAASAAEQARYNQQQSATEYQLGLLQERLSAGPAQSSQRALEEKQKSFEEARQAILGSIGTDPANSWALAAARITPNPWANTQVPLETQIEEAQAGLDYLRSEYNSLQERANDPNDPLTMTSPGVAQALADLKAMIFSGQKGINQLQAGQFAGASDWVNRWASENGINYQQAEQTLNQYFANPESIAAGEGLTVTQQGEVMQAYTEHLERANERNANRTLGIQSPDWLRPFYAGNSVPLTGIANARQNLATPSGQSWMRLTPTQQSQLVGLAEFSGLSSEDFLSGAQRQLPQTLRLGNNTRARRYL